MSRTVALWTGSGRAQPGTVSGQLIQVKMPGVPLGVLSPLVVALLLVLLVGAVFSLSCF